MRNFLFGLGLIITFVLAGCAGETKSTERTGPWELVSAQSHISFVTVKNDEISEAHSFTDISGIVGEDGKALITIALDSVHTNIDIRDERMRTYLFETETYPVVKIGAHIGTDVLATLLLGSRQQITMELAVETHGILTEYEAEMWVTRLDPHKVLVESRTPVLVHGDDFGFEAGLAKLQELASLSSITPSVSVNFSLVFER